MFRVVETEKNEKFSVTVYFRKKKLFQDSITYGERESKYMIGGLRSKAVKKIVEHFCGQ